MRSLPISALCLLLAACDGGGSSGSPPGPDTPDFPGLDTLDPREDTGGGAEDTDPFATGTLEVDFVYNGAVPVNDLRVAIPTDAVSCGDFDAAAPWEAAFSMMLDDLGATATFLSLPAAKTYVLYATARGPGGQLAAAGCRDGVVILPEDQGATTVTLELYQLVLDPRGLYTVHHDLDLGGAAQGPADAVLDAVAALYDDPADALWQKVRTIALLNSTVEEGSAAFQAFSSSLQGATDAWFSAHAPAWIDAALDGGEGLGAAVDRVTLTSDLDLGGLAGDLQFSGTWTWTDLAVGWPGGCTEGSGGCETLHFGPADLVASDYPVYLSTDTFTASVSDFNVLALDSHDLSLSPGALTLFLIHEKVLPAAGGPGDLLDLVDGFADCAAIVAAMVPSAITGIGLEPATIEGMCGSAVKSLTGDLEDAVEAL
ncbi:MAG: hypothetical protein FJ098_15995, partial [Deltaproteobacteria bacterium]|nr:hypothetical protein [Deltaproteobacteria bacterium]